MRKISSAKTLPITLFNTITFLFLIIITHRQRSSHSPAVVTYVTGYGLDGFITVFSHLFLSLVASGCDFETLRRGPRGNRFDLMKVMRSFVTERHRTDGFLMEMQVSLMEKGKSQSFEF